MDFTRQLALLCQLMDDGVLGESHLQCLLEGRNPFAVPMDVESQLRRLRMLFYDVNGGITLDQGLASRLPERRSGFGRLLVNPKGLTLNGLVLCMKETHKMKVVCASDLDAQVAFSERSNIDSYGIWVPYCVKVDEKLGGLSAVELERQRIRGETLIEHLIHLLVFFLETGKTLEGWTMCPGSKDRYGSIPVVDSRSDGTVSISWRAAIFLDPKLAARPVVD